MTRPVVVWSAAIALFCALLVSLLGAWLLATPATAKKASLKATVALTRVGDAVRLDVRLTSRRAFKTSTRPRKLRLTGGGHTYRLRRVWVGRKSVTWRSTLRRGAAARAFERLGGRRVVLKVRTRHGRRTLRAHVRRLGAPGANGLPGGGPNGGAPGPVPGVLTNPHPLPPPPASGPADLFLSPSGSDSGGCTQAAPCKTLQRAFNVASAGDVVDLAGGTYPAQRVSGNKGSEDDVVFRGAEGASVKIGQATADQDCSQGLSIWASHVAFQALSGLGEVCIVGEPEGGGAQSDITLWGSHGASLLIDSATRVSVFGGDYGGSGGTYTNHNSGIRGNGSTTPSDILLDGVTLHDQACTESYCHIECLIVGAAQRLTIRNSSFFHCPIMGVYLEAFNGPISDVLIENNFFADSTEPDGGPGSGRASVWFNDADTYTNVLVRFNSMKGALHFENGANMVNARAIGNLGPRNDTPCNSGVAWSYNVWTDQSCGGATNAVTNSSPPWVNPSGDANLDYHLTGGIAQNYVPDLGADYQLATDIDGHGRPAGAKRDAGADERG